MPGLVPVGVVRVGGVGHVGRAAHRAGQRPQVLVAAAAEAQDDPLGDGGQQRGRGAAVRGGADLLVVEQHEQRDLAGSARRRRRRRRAAPPARPSDEQRLSSRGALTSSSSTPDERARGEVVEHEVPGEDGAGARRRAARRRRRRTPPGVTSPRPQTGLRCCWALRSSPLVVISRSRWMASCGTRTERPIDEEQPLLGAVAAAHDDPPGQAEVAVEPRVEERAAVHLDGELAAAGPPGVGVRLDPQVRAVGVGADDPEPGGRRVWSGRGAPRPPGCRRAARSAGRARRATRRTRRGR